MWVPPKVHSQLLDERARLDAELLEGLEVVEILEHFTRELQKIDPYLHLLKAKEDATQPGLRPGYFHVVRNPPDAPAMVEVLEGPNGEFVEPGSNVFDLVERSDMWSARAMRLRQKKELDAVRSKERDRERERDERVEELYERWKRLNSTQIVVGGTPWARS